MATKEAPKKELSITEKLHHVFLDLCKKKDGNLILADWPISQRTVAESKSSGRTSSSYYYMDYKEFFVVKVKSICWIVSFGTAAKSTVVLNPTYLSDIVAVPITLSDIPKDIISYFRDNIQKEFGNSLFIVENDKIVKKNLSLNNNFKPGSTAPFETSDQESLDSYIKAIEEALSQYIPRKTS